MSPNEDPIPSVMTGFAPGVPEQIGFFVYLLIDPRDGDVFYVGKGTGNRCFAHLAEARNTLADSIGDYAKLSRIRSIESNGATVKIDLLRHGLTEQEAFLVESSAIDLLGRPNLENRVVGHEAAEHGRMSVADLNALYGAEPVTIDPRHRVVLIRINRLFERGMSDDALYEATRKWWKVSPRKRQVGSAWAPEWAMAVFGGVVRAVHRIDGWEASAEEERSQDPNVAGRWGFRGQRDQQMEATYLHRDVSSYLRAKETGRASQNPIRYEHCSGDSEG